MLSQQRDLRVAKGFPFSRELTGLVGLLSRLSRGFSNPLSNSFRTWRAFTDRELECDTNSSESIAIGQEEIRSPQKGGGKVSFPKVGKKTYGKRTGEETRESCRERGRVPLSLVLSADEPREFNRRTSLQEKKTIFSVHLQRCTRSCLQWFPPTTSFAGRRERFRTT